MTEVAVIGAGLMGHALALVFALGGHQVRLTDTSLEALERAPNLMATALNTLAEAGEVDASWNRQRLSQAVRCIPSLEQTVPGAAHTHQLEAEVLVGPHDRTRADTHRKTRHDGETPQFEALARRHEQQDRRHDDRQRRRQRPAKTSDRLFAEFVAQRPQGDGGQQHGREMEKHLHWA